MGVNGLWTIIKPASLKCPADTLKNKVIAVDASVWIMQGNNSHAGMNAFIKIIFFRIRILLRLGACPVFVFEGSAPAIKHNCLQQRRDYSLSPTPIGERGHLQDRAKQLILLLSSLGIPYLYSRGEGEALCALLNSKGVVDGCITEDVDFFLFGGKTLYRFISTDLKDNFISVFDLSTIKKKLKMDQRAMIGAALILGCDFLPKGVPGIGKVKVKKLMKRMAGIDLLDRFDEWRKENNNKKGSEMEDSKESPKKKTSTRRSIENEVKSKALLDSTFPNKKVIEEYLTFTDNTPSHTLRWSKPEFNSFQETMYSLVRWNQSKCKDNFLPILTAWVLHQPNEEFKPLQLRSIIKKRTLRGIPHLEVLWSSEEPYLQGNLTTLEREEAVKQICPEYEMEELS